MYKILTYSTLLTFALFLTGCFSATEEIWIESDGSGRMEVYNDLSNLYPFLMMGLGEFDQMEDMSSDPMDKEDKVKEEAPDEPNPLDQFKDQLLAGEDIDTIYDFGVLLQQQMAKEGMPIDLDSDEFWEMALQQMRSDDSMTEDQKLGLMTALQAIMHMQMRLQISGKDQRIAVTTIQAFEEPDELQSLLQGIMNMAPLMNEDDAAESPFPLGGEDAEMVQQLFGGQTRYELVDDQTLRITRQPMDFSDLDGEAAQGMAMIRMFAGDDDYRLVIHLPGRVRRISHPDAEKLDRQTVVLDIPADDLFDPEEALDFTITFRNRQR